MTRVQGNTLWNAEYRLFETEGTGSVIGNFSEARAVDVINPDVGIRLFMRQLPYHNCQPAVIKHQSAVRSPQKPVVSFQLPVLGWNSIKLVYGDFSSGIPQAWAH